MFTEFLYGLYIRTVEPTNIQCTTKQHRMIDILFQKKKTLLHIYTSHFLFFGFCKVNHRASKYLERWSVLVFAFISLF